MPLPESKREFRDRVVAREIDPEENAAVQALRDAHTTAVDVFNSMVLDELERDVARKRALLAKTPPPDTSYAHEIARRRAALAHEAAKIDLDEALSELGERYAVIDPRNRITAEGKIAR